MIEDVINIYFLVLGISFVLFWIAALFYWARLIFYVYYKKPKYWDKIYSNKIFPNGKTFFRFYFGEEDFNDKRIKFLKTRVRSFILASLTSFFILFLSMLIIGIFMQ